MPNGLPWALRSEDPGAGALRRGHQPLLSLERCSWSATLRRGLEAGRAHFSPSPCPSLPFAGRPCSRHPTTRPMCPRVWQTPRTQQTQHASPTTEGSPRPAPVSGSPTSLPSESWICPPRPAGLSTPSPLPRPLVPGEPLWCQPCVHTSRNLLLHLWPSLSPCLPDPNHSCVPLSRSGRLVP